MTDRDVRWKRGRPRSLARVLLGDLGTGVLIGCAIVVWIAVWWR